MQNSPLIQLFKSLDKKALRDLSKWLRSPFFNQRADVTALFDYLKAQNDWSEAAINKQQVFGNLFPTEVYDDAKIRYAMSFLHQQIKDYLAYHHWQSQPFQKEISTLNALRQHHQETAFQKSIKQLDRKFQKTQNFTTLRHFQVYQMHLEQYRSSLKKSRTDAMNLQEVSDALTTFYICESLRVACLMVAHETVNTTIEYQPELLETILQKATESTFSELPEIAIYYNTYFALTRPEEARYFKKLKDLITTHWQRFAIDEMRDIYLLAINYCIKKLNQGERQFIREALDLYKVGLEKNILLEKGVLSRFTYNNALTLSLMLDEFRWARTFLETYQSYLPTASRRNVYLYNLTIYHFRKKEYHKVMELLQQVQFRDVLYNLHTRRMLMQSYFELEEFDALHSLLDSFQVFIRRRRDLGYHRENYMNLIKFVRKFLAVGHQKSERSKLIKKVKATSAVADKEWLLEKIEH